MPEKFSVQNNKAKRLFFLNTRINHLPFFRFWEYLDFTMVLIREILGKDPSINGTELANRYSCPYRLVAQDAASPFAALFKGEDLQRIRRKGGSKRRPRFESS